MIRQNMLCYELYYHCQKHSLTIETRQLDELIKHNIKCIIEMLIENNKTLQLQGDLLWDVGCNTTS